MAQAVVLRMRRELSGPLETPIWPAGVTVRTLGPKPDRKLAQGAHAVLEAGFWQGGGGAPIFRHWWSALRKDFEFDPSLIFLAIERGEVIGMAHCWTSAFVKDLAVHTRARRRGIGRALMFTVFHAFALKSAPHVELRVREENAAAIALYRSIRMQTIAREPG